MADTLHIPTGLHTDAEAEARLDGVPDRILLPYQQRWVADEAQVKVHEKSRRIGISWAEAADDALYAAQRNGGNVYYLAYNQDMTRQFVDDAAWWAKWYNLAASEVEEVVLEDEDRSVKVFQIEFDSGHVIQALPSTPRNLRSKGKPGDRVVIDEFAFVDQPDELMKAAVAFVVWGGQIRIISTHDGVMNAFNQLVEEVRAGKKPYSVHRTTFQEAVAEGLYKRICLMKGQPWSAEAEAAWVDDVYDFYGSDADEELDVVPSQSGGRYLSRMLVERSMSADVPVLRLALDDAFAMRPDAERTAEIEDWCALHLSDPLMQMGETLKTYAGFDFARFGDLSFLWVAQRQPDLALRAAFGLELRNVPYQEQITICRYIFERIKVFVYAAFDGTGNGGFLAERMQQRFGFGRVEAVMLNNGWYTEHMPPYRAAFEDSDLVLAKDADVLDDHMDIERVQGVPKLRPNATRKGTDGGQRHGDAAIAGCLLWYASRQMGAPIDYETTGERRAGGQLERYTDAGAVEIDADTGWGTVRTGTARRGY